MKKMDLSSVFISEQFSIGIMGKCNVIFLIGQEVGLRSEGGSRRGLLQHFVLRNDKDGFF